MAVKPAALAQQMQMHINTYIHGNYAVRTQTAGLHIDW